MADKVSFCDGMMIRIKTNIEKSLRAFGSNREKDSWAGQVRRIHKKESDCVYIYRTDEEMKNGIKRIDRQSWKFHIDDIELAFDIEEIESKKQTQHTFDPQQLVI